MSALIFSAQAPSNIALIKYMGKKDPLSNLPENGSISMTLDGLCSVAQLSVESRISSGVSWIPETPRGFSSLSMHVPELNENGVLKLVRHAERVSAAVREIFPAFGLGVGSTTSGRAWVFRTANTFPQGSGIASSASSFAAITLAVALACAKSRESFESAWRGDSSFRAALARVSRLGSGSSCRSLDGPWVMWEEETVSVLPSSLPPMAHFVLLVSDRQKKISSSEAHLRVKSSPLWEGRARRVAQRLAKMKEALAVGNLEAVARITWSESWEMHSLFHTCESPFSYWEPATIAILGELAAYMGRPLPPIATLDAGPNVHVIVPAAEAEKWTERLIEIAKKVESASGVFPKILRDRQGGGGFPVGERG